MTQISEIKKYLETHPDGLTSMDAIRMFGATRLADIIFRLKYKYGMNIVTVREVGKNRYGKSTHYAIYKIGE